MMGRVLKFAVNPGVNVIQGVAPNAKFCDAGFQPNDTTPSGYSLYLWLFCPVLPEEQNRVSRTFVIVLTGQPVEFSLDHKATARVITKQGQPLVVHVFEDMSAYTVTDPTGTPVAP